MQYLQSKSLGFDKEQMLVIERVNALSRESANTFVEEVRSLPEVMAAAGSASLPGRQRDFFGNQFQPEGSSEILTTKTMLIADDLAETIGLELVEGSWFSKDRQDSLTILLNETAVKTMGLQNPIGLKLLNVQQRREGNITVAFTIIGVVKDFHFQSLRDPITPLVLINSENFGGGFGLAMARIKAGENTAAIAAIEQKWKQVAPDQPFKYLFLDENFNANYKAERQAGNLFAVFAGLAILVACVGLFGLSAYTAHLRTKEIGIRKVMGASVASTAILLARDFTRMVIIAFVIAIPASWFLAKQWLDGFAYRVEITIGIFVLAGFTTILIAWITVSFQAIRTALLNPVQSLKSE
jgi:putative ABC transport system permease protein